MKSPRVKAVLGVLQVAKSKSLRRWKELVRRLALKAPPIIGSRRQFKILLFYQKLQIRHDISWESSAGRQFLWSTIPYFCRKLGKMSQNLLSAAVLIGALRVNNSASMRENLTSLHVSNKGADQPEHMRSLIHAFIVRCLESTLTTLDTHKISVFILASLCRWAGWFES